jgi:predicted O-methyltransferase YrrM
MVAMRSIDEIVAASASVPGWIEGEDARQVALASFTLRNGAAIVEIGAYMGRCTVLLAGARRLCGSGRVHCVDPFDCSGDAFSVLHYRDGLRATGIGSLEDAFRQNIARFDLDRWIEVHRGMALDIAASWSQPIDLLLLDGDQSPAGARAAYERWMPFLRRGGIIVLRNTRDRKYAEGHDGHRRLVLEEILPPYYRDIRQVGATTFAIKEYEAVEGVM